MRRLSLALFYYLLLTPVGLVSRMVHDPLHRRWRPHAESYWRWIGDRGRAGPDDT